MLKSCFGAVVFCLLSTAASQAEELLQLDPAVPAEKIDDKASVAPEHIWPDRTLLVCWENPTPSDQAARDVVERAVKATWQKYSGLTFEGWGACPPIVPDSTGIRILINDEGPHTKGLGKQLAGMANGMVFNFTFQNWGTRCQQMTDKCIYAIAVHEFGHALAFSHEQNRYDAPGECALLKQGPTGDLILTPWDLSSVMNYCNPLYGNDGVLSSYDRRALAEIYGGPK